MVLPDASSKAISSPPTLTKPPILIVHAVFFEFFAMSAMCSAVAKPSVAKIGGVKASSKPSRAAVRPMALAPMKAEHKASNTDGKSSRLWRKLTC